MKNKVLQYYFLFSLIVGVIIYIMQCFSVSLPSVINNYVNDFLIVPIVLIPSLWVLRKTRKSTNYCIPFWIVFYLAAMYSIIFEYLLPSFHPRYTSDIIDVVLYFVSGFLFYFLQKLS